MLFSVQEAMNAYSVECSLMANLKLKDADFKGNQRTAMNVECAAQVLSGTMVQMIDEVCSNPKRHPMPEKCPSGTDRIRLFSKVHQLCQHMNRWFDIFNGKDTFNPFAKASKTLGPGYADELLEILAWFVIVILASGYNQGSIKRKCL
jgi:hypothetical protein